MKKVLLLSIFILSFKFNYAQDPHFSQYFASPLSVNPANTGFFDGDIRFAINERQQWFNVRANYSTTSISADMKVLADKLPEYDVLALGVMGLFDSSLGGTLQSNYASLSAAYHKNLGYQGSHILTLGVQYTYANLYIDYSKLTFASQFDGYNFNTSIPVYPATTNSSSGYSDLHAGLLYAVHLPNTDFYAGAALYHITRPAESLFSSSDVRLPYRETFNAGAAMRISPASSVLLSGLYMGQGPAKDEMIGAAYGLSRPDNAQNFTIYLGTWLRFNDSYIPYLGIDYQNFSAGLNYAYSYNTANSYKPATFEVSLIYRNKKGITPHCPRF